VGANSRHSGGGEVSRFVGFRRVHICCLPKLVRAESSLHVHVSCRPLIVVITVTARSGPSEKLSKGLNFTHEMLTTGRLKRPLNLESCRELRRLKLIHSSARETRRC
jgi:hypothetical protein